MNPFSNTLQNESRWIKIATFAYFIVCCLIAFLYEGTGDSGDSITHYLYSKYAFQHPEHFFYHWAKPFFVLITAPFAQLGFIGMKIFNVLNATFTQYLTFRIAQKLKIPNAWLSFIILAFCSLYFQLIFSGLTEHFSALMLVAAIYLFLNEKYVLATLIISFLPFVRSEGLLFIGVTAIYLVSKKQIKYCLLLPVGHIVYSIIGYSVHKDFLWVFTKLSYASLSAYGKGPWYHFIEQLYYAAGLPQYILFILGLIFLFTTFFKTPPQYKELFWLIYGNFMVLVIAHSLFWYLGIFNSFGLPRVMNTVMPQFAIIALLGFNFIYEKIKQPKAKMAFQGFWILLLLILPFTNNPASMHFPREFVHRKDQILMREVSQSINANYSDYCIFHSNMYVWLDATGDPFDPKKSQWLYKI